MKRIIPVIAIFVLLVYAGVPLKVHAQSSKQMLSVTPPLFQLTILPGQLWQSSIKVVNGNSYPLTVFAQVVNFAASGESGQGSFVPLVYDDDIKSTLAEWITLSPDPQVIPPEQTLDLAFQVDIPQDAAPGGHFAAILIGTEPIAGDGGTTMVQTSQTVASLFFVRIEGDIIEQGGIREFGIVDSFVSAPEAEFSLRFENKGNVHLLPRGTIAITNMWGKERGIIPINREARFGNVLPLSIRDFRFTWKGEKSFTEIGRYKAVATLGYGANGSQSANATTYFWVIPLKATLITLGSIAAFILVMTWLIRLYIRRMLTLAGVVVDGNDTHVELPGKSDMPAKSTVRLTSYKTVAAPLWSGATDLKKRLQSANEFIDMLRTIAGFIAHYKKFFIFLLLLILGFIGLVLYVSDASQAERDYEVTITEGETTQTLTDEEIEKQ